MSTLKIKVIVGSTRANRFSEKTAAWIVETARKRTSLDVELLDLRDYPLPFFEEAMPPGMAKDQYSNPIVVKWRDKIREADGFIICTPEYNHGYPAVLKNALDYTYFAWARKAVSFVSWGSAGGARGVEQLRLVAIELESSIADVLQCTPDSKGDHILAARFLNRFVPAETPWIHLDLASSNRSGGLAHVPTDFTGFGVRYSVQLLLDQGLLEAPKRSRKR